MTFLRIQNPDKTWRVERFDDRSTALHRQAELEASGETVERRTTAVRGGLR